MRGIRLLLLVVASVAAFRSESLAIDFASHPFFKYVVGEWSLEGELKGKENTVVSITENWKGRAEENSFYMEGSRTMNGETKPFTWTITHNPATDGYEAVMAGEAGADPLRFEGSFSEADLTVTLKAITGAGESSIVIRDSFADEAKETIQTEVKMLDEQGEVTLEGTLIQKRIKTP